MVSSSAVTVAIVACLAVSANGFAPPAAKTTLPATHLSVKNPEEKASRFRALDNEGKTAIRAYEGPDYSSNPRGTNGVSKSKGGNGNGEGPDSVRSSGGGGGGFFARLFGGGGGGGVKAAADNAAQGVENAANGAANKFKSVANGASGGLNTSPIKAGKQSTVSVPGRGTVTNSKWKASRFRTEPDQKEGATAARAFRDPAPPKPQGSTSSANWSIPSEYTSALGNASGTLQKRADSYMKGAISARDFAVSFRNARVNNEKVLEMIGTMPPGDKRAALFRIYTQS